MTFACPSTACCSNTFMLGSAPAFFLFAGASLLLWGGLAAAFHMKASMGGSKKLVA